MALRQAGLIILTTLLLLPLPRSSAQTVFGSLRGLAKDPQGAVLPSAAVTLTNQETKVGRTTVTNGSGEYSFTAINPGQYTVAVTMSGFEKDEEKDITVETGATAIADFTLQLGGSSETVEVSTSEPLIDAANASNGATFSSQQLENLPNLGRNPFVFEKLDNNVVPTGDPRFVRAEDQGGGSSISVAGAPIGANSYAADGIPTSISSGGMSFIPSIESVSDVKIEANTYDAQVGRTGGGNFNATLKSGTKTYHGVLYGETRQTPWSANLYTNKQYNPLTSPYYDSAGNPHYGQAPRPDGTTYLYAGAFGGPLPYSEKYKFLRDTFFWVSEEGYRQAQPYVSGSNSSFEYLVPSAAERTGDFSGDKIGSGNSAVQVNIYDPTIAPTIIPPATTPTRVPLSSTDARTNGLQKTNVIPLSQLNPIGIAMLNAFPTPSTTSPSYGGANFFGSNDFKTRSDEYSVKVDHVFTPWYSAFVSYVHLATQEPAGSILGVLYASNTHLIRYNDGTAFNNVFTLNPTTIVTLAYGFNRYYGYAPQYSTGFNVANGFTQPSSSAFPSDPYTGSSGFPAGFASLVRSQTFPGISFSGLPTSSYSTGLGATNGAPSVNASHNVVAGISKTLGKQEIKAGYVYRLFALHGQPSAGLSFGFNGEFTSSDGKSSSSSGSNGGSPYADALVGNPNTASVTVNNTITQQLAMYHALYVQDDVRLNDKLTINAGIRWEYELGQRELNNQYAVGFDPSATYTFPNVSTGTAVAGTVAHGGYAFAGVNGYPERCCDESHVKFGPRFGVAYELRKGTVMRAGFGVFYAPVGLSPNTPGYSQASAYTPTTPTGVVAVGTAAYLSNPFSGGAGVASPSGNGLGPETGIGGTITAQDFARKFPFVEQYSVDIQHELPYAISLKVGYVGAHSKQFPLTVNINQLPDGTLAQYAGTTGLSKTVSNPFYTGPVGTTFKGLNGNSYPGSGILTNPTISLAQSLLPYPQYTAVNLTESKGYSLYNSLDLKVQKRMSRGLTVISTFTWASNWDNLYSGGSSLNSTSGPQDNYNLKAEYARAVDDLPKRFTAGITYILPVGRGQRFFSGAPRIVDEFIAGWTINDEMIKQDGGPLGITQTDLSTSGLGGNGAGGSVQRPNLVPGVSPCYSGGPGPRLPQKQVYSDSTMTYPANKTYFNANAFSIAPLGTYGNAPRSIGCYGPGYSNMDVSVNKTFDITERVKFEFRAEALNATNTPEFATPTTTLSPGTSTATPLTNAYGTGYGISSGTLGFTRIIQMGGRLTF